MKYNHTAKNYNIQIVRGVAIIAVVCIHVLPDGFPQIILRPFMNFAVGTFLFLSGMLSSAENYHPLKRIKKIVPPYLIWSLIYIVLYNYNNVNLIPLRYLKAIFSGGAATIMYYIFVYIELTLLIPLIERLAKSRFKYWGFFITPLEIIFVRLIPLACGYEVNNYIVMFSRISCLGWFTYYYLGYLLGNGYLDINIPSIVLVSIWIFSIVLQIGEAYLYYLMGSNDCGEQLKLTSILSGVLFDLFVYHKINGEKKYESKLLKLLGDYSFGIYFSHMVIIGILNLLLPDFKGSVCFPIKTIIAIALSAVFVWSGRILLGEKYAKFLALN